MIGRRIKQTHAQHRQAEATETTPAAIAVSQCVMWPLARVRQHMHEAMRMSCVKEEEKRVTLRVKSIYLY